MIQDVVNELLKTDTGKIAFAIIVGSIALAIGWSTSGK
jgi:hypothetical protein